MDILRAVKPVVGLTRAQNVIRVPKAWGEERWLVNNDKYCGKLLLLQPGRQCSLHFHKIKQETFRIEQGKVLFELGECAPFTMYPGDCLDIPVGVKHRFGGLEYSVIVEFSTHHDDEDSYRLEESRENRELNDRTRW